MKDNRIINAATGDRLNFTCENRQFKTNIGRGHPHGTGQPRGSVYEEPLLISNGWSLWLEHVVNVNDDSNVLWLMWYDGEKPAIPMSGIFGLGDFEQMLSRPVQRL